MNILPTSNYNTKLVIQASSKIHYQMFSWEMTWLRSVLGALDLNLSGGKSIARRRDGQERFKTQVGCFFYEMTSDKTRTSRDVDSLLIGIVALN